MQLRQVVEKILIKEVRGSLDIDVVDICDDSRKATAGCLFVAYRGGHVDGHQFVQQAVVAGAVAVLVEEPVDVMCTQIIVPSTRRVAPIFAHAILGNPAQDVVVIGVTGTNGKTTTTTLIEQILQRAGADTGLIGTIEQRTSKGELRESTMTTPEVVELVRTFREMRDLGVQYIAMEVSSHALELLRVAGIAYRVAVFTNLTQDHLDFHETMEAYGQAKGKFFGRLGNTFTPLADQGLPVAVLNADDPWSQVYATNTVQQVVTYGIEQTADVRATNVDIQANGVSFFLETFKGHARVSMQMTGRFSVYNALAATASALALGIELPIIVETLQQIKGVPGRFERVEAGQPYTILVDYSHTPDSLENALTTIREFCQGRVFTVVGCGGDRDRKKRPLMAKIAAKYSDVTVLTSDNPRTEDPECIIDEMEAGIKEMQGISYVRYTSRTEGIRYALTHAKKNDVVLIAGKGHETYQIIGTTKYDFDDRLVAAKIAQELL